MTRISIVGTGYVGLVNGACLAALGHQVTCVDSDAALIARLQRGSVALHEPGLAELIAEQAGHRLTFSTDFEGAVAGSEVTFLTVGTPADSDGSIDLTAVRATSTSLGEVLSRSTSPHTVVVKSTVVPGTTDGEVIPALIEASGRPLGAMLRVVTNPEFLTEGTAINDFQHPDRIVVGSADQAAARAVAAIFDPPSTVPILVTSTGTAEMVKYASNTLLSTLISFANQINDIGSAIGGVDVAEALSGVHLSRYLTSRSLTAPIVSFLEAGCGFGGSCLPKDTAALAAEGRRRSVDVSLLEAVLAVNRSRPERLIDVVSERLGGLAGKRIGVLGLAFKPDTNDTRESPAFPVIARLLESQAHVMVHDPVVRRADMREDLRRRVEEPPDLNSVIAGADAVVIVTRWHHYRAVPDLVKSVNPQLLVVDGRRILSPHSVPNYASVVDGWEPR